MCDAQLVKPKTLGPIQDVSLCNSTNHSRKCWSRGEGARPRAQA